MTEKAPGRGILKKNEVARPLHIQRLEAALDVRPFVNYVEKILNSDGDSQSEDDSDNNIGDEVSREDKVMHGVVTTKQERQSDKLRLYNLTSVGEERDWLRNVLLSSGSESSSDDESQSSKDARIKRLLKERAFHNKHAKDFYKDSSNSRYMYYGAGLLSTIDRYPERRVSRQVATPTTRGRRGRPAASTSTRGVQRRQRGRPRETKDRRRDSNDTEHVDWEDQLHNIKQETDNDEFVIAEKQPGVRGRKKLSTLKSPEALTARRRRHWQLLAKKELGKVQRSRTAAHKETALQSKRLAALCCKHWRHSAMQSQKNMKETIWRCKRLSREMQAYWRRYDRAEREARRRLEREAVEQRKMDVELMEAKRQRRKLNFLITQTELYAHFMQKKLHAGVDDDGEERILRHLDEEKDPRLAAVDSYDIEEMKARAAANALQAARADADRTRQFAAPAPAAPAPAAPAPGDHDQPNIFRGTLKGYQLKGMNWLANLYDQGISGILADEMGLGKTVQCIAFLCHVAERLGVWGPFLVVSPASTLHNWQQECERFVPDFKVVPYWGSPGERRILRQFWERRDLHTRRAAFHVVVTSYQIVVSDLKYLNRVSWQCMILDEAQAIKSAASVRWKLLLGFSCRNRLLLSGTPIQNSMAELWALLHFIMPTLFDSHEEFNEWFSKDIESHAENKTTIDEKHLSRLHMILKPFMLRRIKKDVENELSDKIEIMVHCPLTIRQKLLYIALKKKIKIEELLHFSVGADCGHNADKNFTSNLMNLVMQFRKVCNHPELFERRDVRSPLVVRYEDYSIPKLVAEEGVLVSGVPSKRHWLYNRLCVLHAEYVQRAGWLPALRLADVSPAELHAAAASHWLHAMQLLEASQEKYERLRHRRQWWTPEAPGDTHYDKVLSKDLLLVCPAGDSLGRRKHDSAVWAELLFTDMLWIQGGPFFTFGDHTIHYTPETVEHRAIRCKNRLGDQPALDSLKAAPHTPRAPYTRALQPCALPAFLVRMVPKVLAFPRLPFAPSRRLAHRVSRAGCDSAALRRLAGPARPPHGWAMLQVPDKNQLVSDAGKLSVLDALLRRLKERGHRVLIYSQMTKMIDLLEEYMWHRRHKYMRLDGSSKISARRDMVADFQSRGDIFVFLLSTRAGGLGINLTAADTVIFYDSDWNPTVDQQAMDRAHRLGQTKQVTVYRLICKGTIEERIMQRAREKSEIQRMVISGGNFKPDTLKPKEVVSLLLDDEEIELKYRQKSEEKKMFEDQDRKRKHSILPQQPPSSEEKRPRASASPAADDHELFADTPQTQPFSPRAARPRGSGSRRGRPRGSRHQLTRRDRPAPAAAAAAPAAADEPGDEPGGGSSAPSAAPAPPLARARRGPGRPRLRGAPPRPAPRAARRRRPREPLLVPLAAPP